MRTESTFLVNSVFMERESDKYTSMEFFKRNNEERAVLIVAGGHVKSNEVVDKKLFDL